MPIYRYWSGIYHLFDSSGRWYGKGKCGIGIEMFDCLIVSAAAASRSRAVNPSHTVRSRTRPDMCLAADFHCARELYALHRVSTSV